MNALNATAFYMNFALITPARNEAPFIRGLVDSVLGQTARPIVWVFVSDGSSDGTDDLMMEAARRNPFIRLIRREAANDRSFGSKALAFRCGWDAISNLPFDFVGNLDADITLLPDYYESILVEMQRNVRLGIASGVCMERQGADFRCITISTNHAVGAVQLFRRSCFDAIGGYQPVSVGGMDALAELTARMKGWETRAFGHLPVYHHKPVDSANARGRMRIRYRAGMTEYHIGSSPLFAIAKALRRWNDKPFLLGMLFRLFAYFKLLLGRVPRDASEELVAYLRREQRARMWSWITRRGEH